VNYSTAEIESLYALLTPEERQELDELVAGDTAIWRPLPGPQTMAYYSDADVVGFGGAAGGGKTDLAVGKSLTRHRKVAIFRRVGTELTAIEDRFAEILGGTTGYNSQKKIWREPVPGVQLEFGSVPNLGDERNYQGRPKDLLVLDEAANFLEAQARFLMGWVRTTIRGQHCQVLMCFNPPTSSEGRWIVDFFAPWLRKNHPNPAKPGELRYFAMVGGREIEVADKRPFVIVGGVRVYDFDANLFKRTDIVTPQSRTFIPSRVTDNIYMDTNYISTLQSLPEPLRSQMLNGDFEAGMSDSEWQVIPTDWVDAAQARWRPRDRKPPMSQMGVDVARGGDDNTIIARRHVRWYDVPLLYPGKQTPDGPTVAGLVVAARRDDAPVNIDVIGVGSAPYDFLHDMRVQVQGVNVSEASGETSRSGRLEFFNVRSQLAWQFREMLDPQYNEGVELPPDPRLKADLCAYTWSLRNRKIYVHSREEIIKAIGRSPDYASAYFLAMLDTPNVRQLHDIRHAEEQRNHDPYADGGALGSRPVREHDPYENLG
jgi:hypothetical protein